MLVSFNPIISNPRRNHPSHKAVIPKYVNEAQRQMKVIKCVNYRFIQELIESCVLFRNYSKQDVVETLLEIKKIAPNIKDAIESDLKILEKFNDI